MRVENKSGRKYGPARIVADRKVKRNLMKRRIGSNKISGIWHDYQVQKYGQKKWFGMFKASIGGHLPVAPLRTKA